MNLMNLTLLQLLSVEKLSSCKNLNTKITHFIYFRRFSLPLFSCNLQKNAQKYRKNSSFSSEFYSSKFTKVQMATFQSFPSIKGDRKKGKQGKVSNKEAFGFFASVHTTLECVSESFRKA